MIPTYVLPYFGSNSAIVNTFSAALGIGPTPQWWLHCWSLAMLFALAWMRGSVVDKKFLAAFPLVAGLFDLTPVLSAIPLVPTIFHMIGLVLGMTGKEVDTVEPINLRPQRNFSMIASLVAVAGIGLFTVTLSHRLAPTAPATASQQAPLPLVAPVPAASSLSVPLPLASGISSSTESPTPDSAPGKIATAPAPVTVRANHVKPGAPKTAAPRNVSASPAGATSTTGKPSASYEVRTIHLDD